MEYFIKDLKKMHILLFGFAIMALGIILTKRADLGMAPWGVFHQGLSNILNMKLGTVIQIVGFIILVFSVIFLKTKVGIGTILNVLLVGTFINIFDEIIYFEPSSLLEKLIILLIGLVFITFGRSVYISAVLGPGPRDGVFVGVTRLTGLSVKYVKPSIEMTVLVIGFLLGGPIGVGTIILVGCSGFLVHYFFGVLKFDPKSKKQSDIFRYFNKKARI